MNKIVFLLSLLFLASITACNEPKKPKEKPKKEVLVEIKDGQYTEYYPGRKAVKIRGPITDDKKRTGRWFFYLENGNEQSMSEYVNGQRSGFTWVRYPSGNMRYSGEYSNDKEVGVWRFYNEDGTLQMEKDYNAVQ